MISNNNVQQVMVGLAILASTGTLVQETRVNRALALTAPLTNLSVNLPSHLEGLHEATAAHTHVEQPVAKFQLSTTDPMIQVRNDHRKYNMPKHTSRTDSFSGGSQVLWPNV